MGIFVMKIAQLKYYPVKFDAVPADMIRWRHYEPPALYL